MIRVWLLQTPYLDEPARRWLVAQTHAGRVRAVCDTPATLRLQIGHYESDGVTIILSQPDVRHQHSSLDMLAFQAARAGQIGQVCLARALGPDGRLAQTVRVQAAFHQEGLRGSGVLELSPVRHPLSLEPGPGRWMICRFRPGESPDTAVHEMADIPASHAIIGNPPWVDLDRATFGVDLDVGDGLPAIRGSEAVIDAPVHHPSPSNSYFHIDRARVRAVLADRLRKNWGDELPMALFAHRRMDDVELRDWFIDGGSFAILGGDRLAEAYTDGRRVEPTRLAFHPSNTDDGAATWRRAVLELLPGESIERMVAAGVRADLNLALGRVTVAAPMAPARMVVRGVRAHQWSEPHLYNSIERLSQLALNDAGQAHLRKHVLEPALNRHHAGLPCDNDAAERSLVLNYLRTGLYDPLDHGAIRALRRCVLFALGSTSTDMADMTRSFRQSGTYPALRRDHDKPLALLYGHRSSWRLRETWRWLLPWGSVIRRGVNQLDDDLAPLDGGLTLV